MKQTCLLCGRKIRVMIRKNTNFCSDDCEKEWEDDDLF